MTVFSCGEKASQVTTGEGSTGSTSGASTTEGTTTEVPTGSVTDASTGSVSETASATEAGTTGLETGTGHGGMSTGTGESTAGDSTSGGESTAGEGTTGAGTTGEPPVLDAAWNNACAPNDAPSVALRPGLLAAACEEDWSDEALRIVIFKPGPLAPGVYKLGEGLGFATRQGKDDPDFVTAMQGSVTIESWDAQGVVGSYSVIFVDASLREAGFSGPYCDDDILCG